MAAATASQADPTIFSRLERLDVMMGYLEEIIRVSGRARRSSCASTTSSGTPTGSEGGGGGGGGGSSVGSSPKSLERRCRPLGEVMQETQLKGSLIYRLHHLEERVLKLSLQLQEETLESERKKEEEEKAGPKAEKHHHHHHNHRKGLIKSLVKSCVRGKRKEPKESNED